MKTPRHPMPISCAAHLFAIAILCASMAGCERKPHQTTRMSVCGGFASEHDIKHVGDIWVENKDDDLVFFYTNVSTVPQPRPIFTRADRHSMYYLHIQYEDVTVGCLDPTNFGDPDRDPSPMMDPGETVSGVFTQQEVIAEIKRQTPAIVSQPDSVIFFNYDGYASNKCTFGGVQDALRLACAPNTRADRLADNKARQTFWKKITNDKKSKEWW